MRKRDFILIGIILIIAISLFLGIELTKRDGTRVLVTVNGEVEAVYSLDSEGTYSINGGSNILKIEDGYAFMLEANCPDKKCVHKGKISKVGEVIICLPNAVSVKIIDERYEV